MSELASKIYLDNEPLDSSFDGPVIDMVTNGYAAISWTAEWSGTAVGVLSVQGCSDNKNFVNLNTTTATINNASGAATFDVTTTAVQFLKLHYESTSDTGFLTAFYSARGK